jgi:hypothetical protein
MSELDSAWYNHQIAIVNKRNAELEEACKNSALQAKMAIARQLELESECDKALAANERDRTKLHQIVCQIDEEITGRMWLIEGRGPYEWDDDKYRQEFGWGIHALQEKLEPLRKIAGDLKDCPTTQAAVEVAKS